MQKTPEELTESLKDATREIDSRQMQSPKISSPLTKHLPIIGTLSKDLVGFDSKQVDFKEEL